MQYVGECPCVCGGHTNVFGGGRALGKLLSDGLGKISLYYIYKFICKFDIVSKIILYFEDCYIIKGRKEKE